MSKRALTLHEEHFSVADLLGTLRAEVDLRPRIGRPGRQCQRQRRAERQPPRIVDLVV